MGNWIFFLSPIFEKPLSSIKKKFQRDMVMDNFVYLLYMYLTIYVHFILLSLVDFEKKIFYWLTGTLKNAFFDYTD